MCALQPAVREQANIAGASGGGTWATSSTTADQYSTFVHEWLGLFFAIASCATCSSSSATATRGEPSSLATRFSTRDRGSSARYTRWPKPMIRSPRARASATHFSASPLSATASSIGRTRAGAPPCRGPDRAPTAEDRDAAASAPVLATILAVNVDAFRPCSAVQIQYVSSARAWFS